VGLAALHALARHDPLRGVDVQFRPRQRDGFPGARHRQHGELEAARAYALLFAQLEHEAGRVAVSKRSVLAAFTLGLGLGHLALDRGRGIGGAQAVEDRIFEDRVEALAHTLQRLGYAYRGVGERTYRAQRGQQRRRGDAVDRRVPDLGRHVVFKRGNPLSCVLVGLRRLDDALVIVASGPGQSRALAFAAALFCSSMANAAMRRPSRSSIGSMPRCRRSRASRARSRAVVTLSPIWALLPMRAIPRPISRRLPVAAV
jgi:hypothetical protein